MLKRYLLPALLLVAAPWLAQAQTTPSGNVGIGTTAPTQTLDVNGALRVRGLSGSGIRLPTVQPDGTLGMSDPFNSTITPPPPTTAAIGSVGTGYRPVGVAVSGTTAYVVNNGSNTLQVFDVSKPTSPALLSSVGTGSFPVGVAVSGTTAYVLNYGSNTLQVFDVSKPTSPALLGSVGTGSFPTSVAVSGTTAYVVNQVDNTLQTFDVSKPTSPTLLGSVGTSSYPVGVAVSGTTAYVINYYGNTLQAFSVGNPASPALLGSVGTGSNPHGVVVSGTTAYVVNQVDNTLQVFDIRNPASPALLGSAGTGTGSGPSSVAVSGTTAYVVNTNSNTLQTFDVSDPTSPALLGSVGTDSGPSSVAVSGMTAYVVNYNSSTLQVTAFPPQPRAVAVNPDGTLASVALHNAANFIQNTSIPQTGASFNVDGTGTVGGAFTAGTATVNGNMGIGTSPVGGLHIDRPEVASSSALGVTVGGGTSGNPSIELRGSGKTPYLDFVEASGLDYTTRLLSSGGTLNLAYGGEAGSKPAYLLSVDGGITANGQVRANGVVLTSDARFKTRVRPLTGALSSVLALRGVRYEWNALGIQHGGTAGAGQVGVLAQEVEKVYPELVSTDKDGYKAVNYAQLTPVLLEAIKEQQQQIENLKAEAAAAKTAAGAASSRAASAEAKAAQATATLESFEARLRRLEAGSAQAQR